jgi:SAM-dependent methyltransferase
MSVPPRRRRVRSYLQRLRRPAWLGTLRRTTPISNCYGFDRGTPVDRYYIDSFLREHGADIQGRVVEVKDSRYTSLYGLAVERAEVWDVDPTNPRATVVADLAKADDVASNQFDCFILTQTLQYVYDLRAAVAHIRRVLKPGGVLLATLPAVSRLDPEIGAESDYWRFMPAACGALFAGLFGSDNVTVRGYGNVLAAIGFLTGLAAEELSQRELDTLDDSFPLIVAVRAVKPRYG